MRRASNQQTKPSAAFADSPITAANYTARAVEFARANPLLTFVICWKAKERQGANREGGFTAPQWKAWLEYFEQIRLPTIVMRAYGVCTVPTEWPEDFDPSAPPSDKGWAPALEFDGFNPAHQAAMRERVGKLYRDLSRSIDAGHDPLNRRPKPQSRAEALAALSEGFAHLQAPLAVSEALRASNERRASDIS